MRQVLTCRQVKLLLLFFLPVVGKIFISCHHQLIVEHCFIIFVFAQKWVEELKVQHWFIRKLQDGRYFLKTPVFTLFLDPGCDVFVEDVDLVDLRDVFAVGPQHAEKLLAGEVLIPRKMGL